MSTVKFTTKKSFKSLLRERPKHTIAYKAYTRKARGFKGKFNWGRPGDELIDEKFDSRVSEESMPEYREWEVFSHSNEQHQLKFARSVEDLREYKKQFKQSTTDFLDVQDPKIIENALETLALPIYNSEAIYILIKASFDRSDAIRHQVSNLIFHLVQSNIFTPSQVKDAIRKLYNQLNDIILDCPKAPIYTREYAQFLIAGKTLSPSLVDQFEFDYEALLDTKKIQSLKETIRGIVEDYFENEDLPEAVISFRELDAPFMGFELVKQLVSIGLDRSNHQREGASIFISDQCCSNGCLQPEDVEKGFTILLDRVEELSLDVPDIFDLLPIFLARAIVDEVIPPAFLLRVGDTSDLSSKVVKRAQDLLDMENANENLVDFWNEMDYADYLQREDLKKQESSMENGEAVEVTSS
jgi:hypothetical protein